MRAAVATFGDRSTQFVRSEEGYRLVVMGSSRSNPPWLEVIVTV